MQKITLATPKENYCVYLEYDDGATFLIDLSQLIRPNTVFAVLEDTNEFAKLEIGARGRSICWSEMLELDADSLRLPSTPENGLQHKILISTPSTAITPDPISLEVQRALKLAGVTQTEAAKRTGLTQPTIARLANPNYHGHSIESLRRLGQGLGLQLEVRITKP
jgi:predicted XRE-type DNA-binding protein